MEIVGNTRTIARLEAETSYLSKAESSTSSELIPKNSSLFNVKMPINSVKITTIFTLNKDEFFGMSSDDAELFLFDKYDVSAFKRTIKRVFSTISTSQFIPDMSIWWILDFSCISKFHEGASKEPEMLGGPSIRIQAAQ